MTRRKLDINRLTDLNGLADVSSGLVEAPGGGVPKSRKGTASMWFRSAIKPLTGQVCSRPIWSIFIRMRRSRSVLRQGGWRIENKHSTDVQFPTYPLRQDMSIHSEDEPCSDLGCVLVLNNPPATFNLKLNSVSDLVSKVWCRIPFEPSE